jgi:hypothetical protein
MLVCTGVLFSLQTARRCQTASIFNVSAAALQDGGAAGLQFASYWPHFNTESLTFKLSSDSLVGLSDDPSLPAIRENVLVQWYG